MFTENMTNEEVDKWASVMHGNNIVPIFQVSSVTGSGLPQLSRFISKV